MPRLYDYSDFRQYLRDTVMERRQRNPGYSFRSFARSLGLSSSTVLRIAGGQRNISRSLLPLFTAALNLKGRQAEYFGLLVKLDREKDPALRRSLHAEISRFRKNHARVIPPAAYSFYDNWYTSVMRELIDILPAADERRLGAEVVPPISPRQARQALKMLQVLGLIERDAQGLLRQKDRVISTGDTWEGLSIHSFQKAMAELGVQALDRFSRQERDISTVTLSLSDSGAGRMREILTETRARVMDLARSETAGSRVFQLNLQFFPVSRTQQRLPS